MTFLDGRPPRVIAHRGLAIDAPENTLLAFARALSARATHLETDIHASADGVAVIAHDADLTRVAGRDVTIAHLTMPELRRIDLGHGQGFCTLAQALDAFPDARFNIDVKDARAAAPAVEAIRAARAVDRVLITSFSPQRRRAVTDQLPGVASSPAVSEFLPILAGATQWQIAACAA
ncbi:glycerophosphodiester phosphodiesterase family protein [Leifsonia sp. LS-T14]|uniref:glycerophosphodiester phosphodiesterase family protein n=1 Tax=unclassified Leifsonia TaxID=2663824 RepID=UPI0035A65471